MFVVIVLGVLLLGLWRSSVDGPTATSAVRQDDSPSQYALPAKSDNSHFANSSGGSAFSDGRTYSIALIATAPEIPLGTRLFGQGRVASFGYAGMRSRPFAVIQDEQEPVKTLLCAMPSDEGPEVISLHHQGEIVHVNGEYMGSVSIAGNLDMPTLSDCKVTAPTDKVVRHVSPTVVQSLSNPSRLGKLTLTVSRTIDGARNVLGRMMYVSEGSATGSGGVLPNMELLCDTTREDCFPLVSGEAYGMDAVREGEPDFSSFLAGRNFSCVRIYTPNHTAIYAMGMGNGLGWVPTFDQIEEEQ